MSENTIPYTKDFTPIEDELANKTPIFKYCDSERSPARDYARSVFAEIMMYEQKIDENWGIQIYYGSGFNGYRLDKENKIFIVHVRRSIITPY